METYVGRADDARSWSSQEAVGRDGSQDAGTGKEERA